MRLVLHLILFLITIESYCQDKPIQILTYRHGCHGNCDFSYNDSCGLRKDSIIEIIKIVKLNNKYYQNGKLIDNQKLDSLEIFITNNLTIIKGLVTDIKEYSHATFIPPDASCFEFEEYTIHKNDKVYFYKLLNKELSKFGYFIHDNELDFFRRLNKFIK